LRFTHNGAEDINMHPGKTIFSLSVLGFFSLLAACSRNDNDVGSLADGGGGVSGSPGATGDTSGTGGITGKTSGTGGTSAPGTGGISGTGGASGTGGTTQVIDASPDQVDANEPTYCAPCVDLAAAKAYACPPSKPAPEDLASLCRQSVDGGVPSIRLRLGECSVPSPLPGCTATTPDATVDVLSFDFSPPGGLECQYSRATGLLVGQSVVADTPRYCGGRAYVAGAVASACSNCGPDELCVAYYDGTCKPMNVGCNKVSATTRESILVNHERCFAKPIGDEICGLKDGQHFWGCGEPTCGKDKETLLSDINCYGP
jgi:hypothetical protein